MLKPVTPFIPQQNDEPEETGTISLWGTIFGQRRRAKKVPQYKVDKAKERPKRVQEWYEREPQPKKQKSVIRKVLAVLYVLLAILALGLLGFFRLCI